MQIQTRIFKITPYQFIEIYSLPQWKIIKINKHGKTKERKTTHSLYGFNFDKASKISTFILDLKARYQSNYPMQVEESN